MPRYQRRVIMPAKRLAHPTMGDLAKGAAELVAPRTVEDGVTLANILGDAGEMTPFAPAVPFLESRMGLRGWDDETIAAMALLGLIPFGGKVAREAGKGIRKTAEAIERIPKGNKGGFILASNAPKKRGWVQVDNEATQAFNDKVMNMAEGPMPRGAHRDTPQQLRELAQMDERGAYKDYVTDLAEGVPWEYNQDLYQALDMIKKQYPDEYRKIILEDWDGFAKQPDKYTNLPVEEHLEPRPVQKYGTDPTRPDSYFIRFDRKKDSPSSIQFTIGELEDALQSKQVSDQKLKAANDALNKILDDLNK